MTIIRCHTGLRLNARGLSLSSPSPSIEQEPPIGSARITYSVSFPFLRNITGPIPRANSFTLIPQSFAAVKCPSSWIMIMTQNARIAITICI